MEILPKQYRVPEIYGDYWFNSEPIPLAALRGYPILIDFWDYTCQSCLRSLPYLKEWHRRYSQMGLVVIGVHTPKFPFARDPIIVREAIDKLGVKYPVVSDNDSIIWGAFRNREWPTKYLIDKDGYIRYIHAGDDGFQNYEHAIQSVLSVAGHREEFPLIMDPLREEDRDGVICYRATTEILTGYQRGSLGNVEAYSPESTVHYEDPGIYLSGRIYLHGKWHSDRNFLRLNECEGKEGFTVVSYQAKEVNAVIKPEGEKDFQVFVQQDGKYLTVANKGDDVHIDEQRRSYILVDTARLYSIVKNKDFGDHQLKLITRSNGFALYSFTFVSSVIPELISKS
jgi:thiol-disulfide isomerase/thioredoxin